MMLCEEGKLSLDQPVCEVLPAFKMADERYQQITVRMLLNHSSGLYGSTFQNAMLYDDPDTYVHDHFLEALSTQKLKDDPGAFSVYCNDGFSLAELVVEKVSGMSFTDFVHEKITKPLGMNNTYTPLDDFDRKDVSRAYDSVSGLETPVETIGFIGAGGIYSTAEDICRFGQLFTGESKLLAKASLEEMAVDQTQSGIHSPDVAGSMLFGLGWDNVRVYPFDQYEIKALTKGGDTNTMHSTMIVLPEYDLTAVILTSGAAISTYDQIAASQILLAVLADEGKITLKELASSFPEKEVSKEVPKEVEEKLGAYASTGTLYHFSLDEEGNLVMKLPYYGADATTKYAYIGDGFFTDEKQTTRLKFVTESNGKTYLWTWGYGMLPGIGSTVSSAYAAQRLDENLPDEEVLATWGARAGKIYLSVNEKYTSLLYGSVLPMARIALVPEAPGYILGNKIVDADHAENILRVPTVGSRDVQDITFESREGVEYLQMTSGGCYMDFGAVKPIFDGEKSICTIQKNGYTRWYTVPDTAAGSEMNVTIPENAGFAVYNAQGLCVANSVVSGNQTVTLPKGGFIAFIGEVDARFVIDLTAAQMEAAA